MNATYSPAQEALAAAEAALEAAEKMPVMWFDPQGNEVVALTPVLRAAFEATKAQALEDLRKAQEWAAEEAHLVSLATCEGMEDAPSPYFFT